jgi:hypothetical protein
MLINHAHEMDLPDNAKGLAQVVREIGDFLHTTASTDAALKLGLVFALFIACEPTEGQKVGCTISNVPLPVLLTMLRAQLRSVEEEFNMERESNAPRSH